MRGFEHDAFNTIGANDLSWGVMEEKLQGPLMLAGWSFYDQAHRIEVTFDVFHSSIACTGHCGVDVTLLHHDGGSL